MTLQEFGHRDAVRFLRTLRVVTHTALAHYDLQRGRKIGRPGTVFQALAAKAPGEWHFPASGLTSTDGLIVAKLLRQQSTVTLQLQAQGLAGLSTYANKAAHVRFGADNTADGVFDRDGQLNLSFERMTMSDIDLSTFELQMKDGAP